MMAAACGFPRFALDFSPRGEIGTMPRWSPGARERVPPGYAGVPWMVVNIMKNGFKKQKIFINCKGLTRDAHYAPTSPKANSPHSPHAPPTYPHGVSGINVLPSSVYVSRRAKRKGARP